MAATMFRCVFLCVMFAVAQSQLTCTKMDATMTGGLCDGMKASPSVCVPAGTPSTYSYPGTDMNAAACTTQQATTCTMVGGTANKDFCAAGVTSGFCKQVKGALLATEGSCATNADCAKAAVADTRLVCCADYKTMLGNMCTGIKELDAMVTVMKTVKACADTDCLKIASSHSVRASSLVALAPLLLSFAFFKF